MDWLSVLNLGSMAVFVVVLALLVYRDRKNVKIDLILVLRKTRRGRGLLKRIAGGSPRFWKALGTIGVAIGFLTSLWISVQLLLITGENVMRGGMPGMGLVLPSFGTENVIMPGLILPQFWYWIIVIAMLVVVHEGMHGIMSAAEKVKIKALGWGLLLVIPLAFVEPDEKKLAKRPLMTQLRVFAAGSFGNFMLAGVVLLVSAGFASALFMEAGVAFQGYPGSVIRADQVTSLGGIPVSGPGGIWGALAEAGNGTLNLTAGGNVYYMTRGLLEEQAGQDELAVFSDYSAVREGLSGTIVEIEGRGINSTLDLTEALAQAGPNSTIAVTTFDGEEHHTFMLETADFTEGLFVPDMGIRAMAWIEQFVPGAIGFSQQVSGGWAAFWGQAGEANWVSLMREAEMWEWIGENYPELGEKAGQRAAELSGEAGKYPMPGFIGISGPSNYIELKPGLEPWAYPINFVKWLLFWLFLINLGVGAFNLLPIGPLDGGRMWGLVLDRAAPKRGKWVLKVVSYFMVLVILVNFAMIFAP